MNTAYTTVSALCFRLYDERVTEGAYLISISTGLGSGSLPGSAYPMARAVMDDFGNLQIVRGWL